MTHRAIACESDQLLDQPFANMVGRMGLAREDELDRPLLIRQELLQARGILQQERGALIGGEAPGEPDREGIRVEDRGDAIDLLARGVAHLELALAILARGAHQPGPAQLVGPPQHFIRNTIYPLENAIRPGMVVPVRSEVAIKQRRKVARQPGQHVHPIGDVPDRHFLNRQVGPEIGPHLARHHAMQGADGIEIVGKAHAEDGHRDIRPGVGPGGLSP